MFIGTEIIIDDIKISDMGGLVVEVNSGGFKEMPFGVRQSLIEEKVGNKYYLKRVEEEPLSFSITIALDPNIAKWDYEKRNKLVGWLFQKDYRCMRSEDFPFICWYVIPVGDATHFDNCLQDGYATIQFRCNASHGWSYPISNQTYDLTDNATSEIIEIANMSNIRDYYSPELEFTLSGSTSISFKNWNDEGRILSFTNLQDIETIYVDNETHTILSSLGENTYRLNDCNRKWLRLVKGVNRIEVTGKGIVTFRMQFPIAL